MRVASSGLIVVFVAAVLLCAGSVGAQAQTFTFEVCNKSNVSASVAVSNLVAVGDSRFEVQGWWTVGAGNCRSIGNFPRGWFYLYAEQTNSARIVWSGKDLNLCIEYPGPFDRINMSGYSCSSKNLKGFTAELIGSDTGTFTWTLN